MKLLPLDRRLREQSPRWSIEDGIDDLQTALNMARANNDRQLALIARLAHSGARMVESGRKRLAESAEIEALFS